MFVFLFFTIGGAAGGSAAEAGGPGVTYLEGISPVYKNLRIDNKCQKPKVCSNMSSLCAGHVYPIYKKNIVLVKTELNIYVEIGMLLYRSCLMDNY